MTIRKKLLLFIPLLVLLTNSVTFFLLQSSKIVQESYNDRIEHMLLYQQSIQEADHSLRSLYSYLLHPTEEGRTNISLNQKELLRLRAELAGQLTVSPHSSEMTNFIRMLDTLLEQEQAALDPHASPKDSLNSYMDAEQTTSFIHEEGQRIVDLELSSYQPIYQKIQHENLRLNEMGWAVFIVNTIMSVVVALWISRSITDPVSRLVGTAKRISKGELDMEPPSIHTSDELGILSNVFGQMVTDLKDLMAKEKAGLEKERLVKELELHALQSQMNPHFLFNSLNVLSKLALIEGAEETSDLIVSMSSHLRYRLSKLDTFVTLQEELMHVEQYVRIQKARFRDRIRFEIEIDEEALRVKVPALTIQPLVENAFVHGIEGMERGAVIRLALKQTAEHVRITISDNGIGMSEERRLALLIMEPGILARDGKAHSAGLGTRNVFKRLQLVYERSDLVDIQSGIGKGTVITLHIPLERSSTHVPVIDRR
ncbi:sensor histidine kinase [Paenibacillus sp. SI8]|uniref:sensor histidine kinase n=1 Tax=unclassified Paenibacillus TaxID=185978 RepID=UPI0034668D0D